MKKLYWVSDLKGEDIKRVVGRMNERKDEFTSDDIEAFLNCSLAEVEETLYNLGLYFDAEHGRIKDEKDASAVIIEIENGENLERSEFNIDDEEERQQAMDFYEGVYSPVIYLTHDIDGLDIHRIEGMGVFDGDVEALAYIVDEVRDMEPWNYGALKTVITCVNTTDQLAHTVAEVAKWDDVEALAFSVAFPELIGSYNIDELIELITDGDYHFLTNTFNSVEKSFASYILENFDILESDTLFNYIDLEAYGSELLEKYSHIIATDYEILII